MVDRHNRTKRQVPVPVRRNKPAGSDTSLLFGLAPALHAVRGATRDALIEAGWDSTASRPQKRLRNVLVVGEVALSLILLVVASLFVRSFMNLPKRRAASIPRGLRTRREIVRVVEEINASAS